MARAAGDTGIGCVLDKISNDACNPDGDDGVRWIQCAGAAA
jgi:hypothetical protein